MFAVLSLALVVLTTQATPLAPPQATILVVYHSGGGHTAALAAAVADGARTIADVSVIVKPVGQVTCAELLATDALIVGSPVYWSNMSGEVKSFFDRWTTDCKVIPPAFPMKDKVGAAFATGGEASSGKEIALMTMVAAMLGNRMIVVSDGQALGATATTGEGGLPLDGKALDEGRRLGTRVAELTTTLKRARR